MSDVICILCHELCTETQTVRLSDDKDRYDITGHIDCTNRIYSQLKLIDNINKLSVKKMLEHINVSR